MSLDSYGRTKAEAAKAHLAQLDRARLLWEAMGRPRGEIGLRMLEEATASMSVKELRHALEQQEWVGTR